MPTHGPVVGNTVITVFGQNFGTAQRPAIRSLASGDLQCTELTTVDDSSIICTVPEGVGISPLIFNTSQVTNHISDVYFYYDGSLPLFPLPLSSSPTSLAQVDFFSTNEDIEILLFILTTNNLLL